MRDFKERRRPLDAEGIEVALDAMAQRILELRNPEAELVLVGIRTGGVPLAQRLAERLSGSLGKRLPLGTLDITLYRDDVFEGLENPVVGPTQIDFSVRDRSVVLVDDVIYSGRTVRSAIDALMALGRPRRVLLATLVDRGGRELPIQPDVVGITLDVAPDESVRVRLTETDGEDAVVVSGPPR